MQKHIKQALMLRRWVSIGHHFPGRIRLKYKLGILTKLAGFKAADIETVLSDIPAFKNYILNCATDSIVIDYDAEIINPQWLDELFCESEADAAQACYQIARCLELDGSRHE
ncbi:hypothetical protein ACTL6P_24590 [Endozoicomonas acroporae]|uniref:cation transporter n=1 Tax=Endozoicomonas acroporae TaxID=1701104 RepID=UPI001580C22A|nr:cation transporter [Endozoicomonas acroporae]